jgi:sugar lactone lactonase YvrE
MVVTPDNATLIVFESFAGRLTAFHTAPDGSPSNRRAWAEGLGPDGICMDAEGAIWVQAPDTPDGSVVRIREGGEMPQRIEHDRTIFATMLGGPDGTTLFLARLSGAARRHGLCGESMHSRGPYR